MPGRPVWYQGLVAELIWGLILNICPLLPSDCPVTGFLLLVGRRPWLPWSSFLLPDAGDGSTCRQGGVCFIGLEGRFQPHTEPFQDVSPGLEAAMSLRQPHQPSFALVPSASTWLENKAPPSWAPYSGSVSGSFSGGLSGFGGRASLWEYWHSQKLSFGISHPVEFSLYTDWTVGLRIARLVLTWWFLRTHQGHLARSFSWWPLELLT